MRSQKTKFDLTLVAEDLERRGTHPEFVKSVKLAFSVASAHQDLEQCREALALLDKMTKAGYKNRTLNNSESGTIAGALFDNAVILYARATDTDPIDRRKWFGRGKLDRADLATHAAVMGLRNKGIAHFGKTVTVDGAALLAEAIVFDPSNDESQISYRANRVHNRTKFARGLDQLAEKVARMAQSAAIDRMTTLLSALRVFSQVDGKLGQLILAHPLDERLAFAPGPWSETKDYRAKRMMETSYMLVENG